MDMRRFSKFLNVLNFNSAGVELQLLRNLKGGPVAFFFDSRCGNPKPILPCRFFFAKSRNRECREIYHEIRRERSFTMGDIRPVHEMGFEGFKFDSNMLLVILKDFFQRVVSLKESAVFGLVVQ